MKSSRRSKPGEPVDPVRQTLTCFNPMRPMKPHTVEEAMRLQSGATLKRAVGKAMREEYGDSTGARFELAEAESMEALADEYLDIGSHVTGPQRVGNGGELVVATQEAQAAIPGVIDTVRDSPDMLTAQASRNRMELTGNALTLATDAAESIQARNSIEKMLAHQLAATHRLGMMFMDHAARILERHHSLPMSQTQSVEACRLANAAGRMMSAYQDGFIALDRIRRGGRQTVKVVHQHVAVGPGGQAVVAGNMKTGAKRRRGKALK